jgi:hypothetical protein
MMITDLKQLLFSILESAYQVSDITATQQMGVQMSNSVKEKGVVIIQNQNVEVYARIVPAVVKAIKICDMIQQKQPPLVSYQPGPIVDVTPDLSPIEACCKQLYDSETKWQDMQDIMKKHYLEYVIGKFHTKAAAAKWLGVGPTYLCKLTKEEKENDPIAVRLDN